MTRLDRDDRCCCAERLARDVRGLSVVGGDAEILERDRGGGKRMRRSGRTAEANSRPGTGFGAERALEERDVLGLVPADPACKRCELAFQSAALVGFGVERVLHVLEQEQGVEDADVLGRGGTG